jgi:hypothetical protein
MPNELPEPKDLTAKKLPCGGYAIFGTDSKKNRLQVGYLGPNLPKEEYLKGIKEEK